MRSRIGTAKKVCSVRFMDDEHIKVVNHERHYTVCSRRHELELGISRYRWANLFKTAVAVLSVYIPFLGNK
ncbi:MAG: hypothetical protein WCP46_00450 [Alphaproteobacteria bacterium]